MVHEKESSLIYLDSFGRVREWKSNWSDTDNRLTSLTQPTTKFKDGLNELSGLNQIAIKEDEKGEVFLAVGNTSNGKIYIFKKDDENSQYTLSTTFNNK